MARVYGNRTRDPIVHNDFAEIVLTSGKTAKVDLDDCVWLSKYNWSFQKRGFAVRFDKGSDNSRIQMHRDIVANNRSAFGEMLDSDVVDHINGDKLDNRKRNLRVCKQSQNTKNRVKSSINKSGFKGVFFDSRKNKWCAKIKTDYKSKHIGYFNSPEEASMAYDKEAVRQHGEFARLNESS